MAYDIQYRLLNEEEKEIFYKDFINFLSVHGIPGEEWERIKKEDKHQMMLMFAQFSDLVIHKSLLNITYVYKRDDNSCVIMKLNEKDFEIASVDNPAGETEIEKIFSNSSSVPLKMPYPEKGREKYIYQLTSIDGYSPCNNQFWELLTSK